MTIVKICKVHGEITIDNARKIIDKNRKSGFYYRCRLCDKISYEKSYAKYKEKIKTQSKEYAKTRSKIELLKSKLNGLTGKERKKEAQNLWFQQNKNDPDYIEKKRKREIYQRENLTDYYIKNLLAASGTMLTTSDFENSALIEYKRAIMKIKRIIKGTKLS